MHLYDRYDAVRYLEDRRLNCDMVYYYASILRSFKNLTAYAGRGQKLGQNFKYGRLFRNRSQDDPEN